MQTKTVQKKVVHLASDKQNPLAQQENPLAPDYQTTGISLLAGSLN